MSRTPPPLVIISVQVLVTRMVQSKPEKPPGRPPRPGFELRFTASDPTKIGQFGSRPGAVNLAKEAVNLGDPLTRESGENRRKRLQKPQFVGPCVGRRGPAENGEPAGNGLFAPICGNDAVNWAPRSRTIFMLADRPGFERPYAAKRTNSLS